MKKLLRIATSLLITLAFLSYIYLHRHAIFGTLAHIKPQYIILILLSQLLVQAINSTLLHITVKSLAHNSFRRGEAFKVTLATSFVNFFLPVVGGASAKAIYLKRRHGINYSSFLAIMYSNYLVSFLASFTFGLLAIFMIGNAFHSRAGTIAGVFFGGGMLACIGFMLFGHNLSHSLMRFGKGDNWQSKVIHKMSQVSGSWRSIKNNKEALLTMSACAAGAAMLTIIQYALIMKSLNISSSIWAVSLLAALGNVSLLFNITPGNIGIRETIYASVFALTKIDTGHVVAFSLLERSLLLIVLGMGWLMFGHGLISQDST